MSYRMGDHDGWVSGGWGDDTGHSPGAQEGWADTSTWGGQQQWDSPAARAGAPAFAGSAGPQHPDPRPGSSGGGRASLIVAGVAAVVVIVGLLAVVALLLVDRDQGTETTVGGSTSQAEVGEVSGTGGDADTPGSAGQSGDSGSADAGTEADRSGAEATGPGSEAAAPAAGVFGGAELAPAEGTYSGTLSQRGTRRSDRDYPVEMTFSSQGSTVAYPTLGCRGTLTPTGNSAGARVYRETITSGRCDPTGTWYVTRGSDDAVSVEYHPSGADYVVVGQLTR